ncbi:hypothetical protein [Paraburkholderia elongata]|uniref:Uncharacterized protein n=1 Tax=Paraburkholderia elongata TaxID=2675747 RepID=A0A972NUX8_9BURK|nr:hypothetical protein [Paraburkholderia elongata]NPT59064.1 hypothetical protein [Paraburkholderia elongata]
MNADQAREQRIQELGVKLCVAETIEERIALWSQLRAEIKARTPAQIKRMESDKGLR